MKRPATKKELCQIYLAQLEKWVSEGLSRGKAVERLSMRQYDFLIDAGIDLDSWILSSEQIKASAEIRRSPRGLSPNGYCKRYPEEKKALFQILTSAIEGAGGEIQKKEKENFRDLDFIYSGKKYKVVLSCPRT